MANSTYRRHLGASINQLPGLEEVLFIQGRLEQQPGMSAVAADIEVGVVFTLGSRGHKVTPSRSTVSDAVVRHRRATAHTTGFSSVLLDAQKYAGMTRVSARDPLDESFVDFQLNDLGQSWALTDAGFIAESDDLALESALGQAARMARTGRRVIATVAVSHKWLRTRPEVLRERIEAHGVPVALAIEHSSDPLGSFSTVKGLLEVLGSQVPISVVRSDLAVIGAIAAGASFGAIGTTSTLRHIFPARGGGPPVPGHSVLVPSTRSWVRSERLAAAVALTPTELHWNCPCDQCANGRIDWLLDEEAIYSHNLYTSAEIASTVLHPAVTDRLHHWAMDCHNAQFINLDIEAATGAWTVPDYLGAWYKAGTTLSPTRRP